MRERISRIQYKSYYSPNRTTRNKTTRNKTTRNKTTRNKTTRNKTAHNKPTRNKPTRNKTTRNKTTRNKTTRNKTTRNKTTRNKTRDKATHNKTKCNKTMLLDYTLHIAYINIFRAILYWYLSLLTGYELMDVFTTCFGSVVTVCCLVANEFNSAWGAHMVHYIPKNRHTILFCFVLLWLYYTFLGLHISDLPISFRGASLDSCYISPHIPQELLRWHWGNRMIAPVPAK